MSMPKKMTHEGFIKGCDNRVSEKWQRHVLLRQTKNFWVSEYGTRYRKGSGWATGEKCPMYCLDLETVKESLHERIRLV